MHIGCSPSSREFFETVFEEASAGLTGLGSRGSSLQ